jgi:glycerol-3-phosphate cytidylyltransferase
MSRCKKNIYVIGAFDLFHFGHVKLLKRAKELGDQLIVAINGDDLVASYKRKPFYPENERLEIVKSCKYVDDAFIINEFDNKKYLLQYKIDVIVHGSDWTGSDYLNQIRVTAEFLRENHIVIEYLPYTSGVSTSDLINRIKNS